MTRPSRRLARAACAALACGAAAVPTATAAEAPGAAFVVSGRGFGHGVGMSQYGAYGQALDGRSARQILAHYYRGTRLAPTPARAMRVLLAEGRGRATVTSAGRWRLVAEGPSRRRSLRLRPGATYALTPAGPGRVALWAGPRRLAVVRGPMRLQPAPGGAVAWGGGNPEAGRTYRGSLRAVPDGTRFDLVNVVGLEAYLRGVVPGEVPAAWGDAAPAVLRAQAVAARSYALATVARGGAFDVYADTRSQVYGGVAIEDARTDRAVAATRGQVVTYRGGVATTYFFSTSGGRTEDVRSAFGGSTAVPYLVSVEDPHDRLSPLHRWPDRPTFTGARLGRLLGLDAPADRFDIVSRTASGRVARARVVTVRGTARDFTGAELRTALGLRATWFDVARVPAGGGRS